MGTLPSADRARRHRKSHRPRRELATDALSVLIADHRHVEELFDRYRRISPTDASRKRILREISRSLCRHSAAEEQVVYPEARRAVDSQAVIDDALDDHATVTNHLADLESLDWRSPEYERTVGQLIGAVRDHFAEEEENLFPVLRARLLPSALGEMAALIEKVSSRAPLRPSITAKSPSVLLSDAAKAAMKTARKAIGAAGKALKPVRRPRRKSSPRIKAAQGGTARSNARTRAVKPKHVRPRKTGGRPANAKARSRRAIGRPRPR
jgi:hemerythrin superfamily protein